MPIFALALIPDLIVVLPALFRNVVAVFTHPRCICIKVVAPGRIQVKSPGISPMQVWYGSIQTSIEEGPSDESIK